LLSNNPIIFSLEIGYATHFALINASAYDAILRWNETKGPIDAYYTNALRLAAPYPLIAGQRESYSDIQQKQTNYAKFVEDSSRAIEIKLYQQRTRDITLGLVLLSLAALATWIKG
jgi:hypothetical protein